jgi:endonuclease YncB( thermonuclease family)
MLGWLRWGRRNDGFEWQKYVRTTIKLRREERKQKIDELRDLAAEGARAAGRQGMAAGRQGIAASRHRFRRALDRSAARLKRMIGAVASAVRGGARAMMGSMKAAGQRLIALVRGGDWRIRPIKPIKLSMRMKISVLFGVLALLAGASSLMQIGDLSESWSAALAGLVALVLLGLAAAPWISGAIANSRAGGGRGPWLLERLRSATSDFVRPLGAVAVAIAGGLIVLGGGAYWWLSDEPQTSQITTSSISPRLPPLPSVKPSFNVPVPEILSGTGRAISGDTLIVGGRVVRLDDIEAVELGQVCRDSRGRAWRCGRRARQVMRDFIARKQVICRDLARAGTGQFQGSCTADGEDLALRIVEAGYAFADGFLFRTYGEAESLAKEARRGVWQGEAQRPADYRAARWARAKARAPGGCPIKGQVKRGAKVYVVPWSPDYARARVRQSRGEQWFCSEAEAAAAGFVPATSG